MIKAELRSPVMVQRVLLLIIAFAICIRLLVVILLGDEVHEISGTYDQVAYDLLAQRVLQGYGFSFPIDWYPFSRADQPTSHWSFLYTLYLSTVYAIFGHHPLAARIIQVLISGLSLWLVYRLGKRLFDPMVGLAAAALTACYAYLILFNASLMTQTFYIITVLASLELALGIVEKSTWKQWVLLGIVLGVGILLRQSLLIFLPLLFGWIWWIESKKPRLQTGQPGVFKGIAIAGVIIAVCILPWTIRNYIVYNDFLLLNSNSGYWFYSSNYPEQGTTFDPTYKAPISQELAHLQEPAIDRALLRSGIGFILADPVRVGLLSFNRIKDYFWLFPSDASSDLSNFSRLFSFGLYLPFMLSGVYLARHDWRMCLPLYLYVLCDGIVCLLTWSAPRYRLPSDAIMMVFAGLAVVTLAVRMRLISPFQTNTG